ncbi:Fe-S protein assembly co-chaperone HscB [Mannheimia granulomatis]|uniref:Co-chaperone protein HscB homolog n=1 Tax=Mannheimia granulomatis TaxID=85402 RepID=A0A6G8JIZ3_9PAST|nr:Fe-S protein assembly co-chaperone HscB [Mannheimia granulomatis]QIM66818.1 Fe-S protein assembly co-chaperone HscB [Mannheimia granulomatis]
MLNPFTLFDLPVQFQLDNARLSERYLALQKQLHPDNFASCSQAEQLAAVQKSADVNEALYILKDPILRAEAIIHIYTGEQKDLEKQSAKDMAFLMQQLEWRESLESIESAKNETKLITFQSEIENTHKQILVQLDTALSNQEWQKAFEICDKLRFTKKLLTEIERVEEELLGL